MARILLIGCGCRGQVLARELRDEGHVVRGTTRDPERLAAIESSGAEAMVADPNRLATLMPALDGASAACWLMGTASEPALHGPRLASLLGFIVDTPVRGLVYETGAVERGSGVEEARRAAERHLMPVEVVDADPAAIPNWIAAMTTAVRAVLTC
jgi:uncharacterized protein YbjT (DUF2867 family)